MPNAWQEASHHSVFYPTFFIQARGLASVLRTLSSGRANYSMEFLAYHPLPETLAEQVIEEKRKAKQAKS